MIAVDVNKIDFELHKNSYIIFHADSSRYKNLYRHKLYNQSPYGGRPLQETAKILFHTQDEDTPKPEPPISDNICSLQESQIYIP